MSMNPSCDSCCEEDAEHVLCEHCMQESTEADRAEERKAAVDFIRDVAKRLSVQTGERAVGGADAAYLLAKAIENGDHRLPDDASEKESETP